jgi:hypothetical protein
MTELPPLPQGFVLDTQPPKPAQSQKSLPPLPKGFVVAKDAAPAPKKPSMISEALRPITRIPSAYNEAVKSGVEEMKGGVEEMGQGGVGNVLRGAGKAALGAAGYVGAPISAPIHALVGEPVQENVGYFTGSEKAGDIAGETAELATAIFTPMPKGLTPFKTTGTAPTMEELKQAAVKGFKDPKVEGLVVKSDAITTWADLVRLQLGDLGVNEFLAPKTWGTLAKLDNPAAGSVVTGKGIYSLRRVLGNAAKSADPTERFAANTAIDSLDSSMARLPNNAIISGDPDAVAKIWSDARGNYAAAKHSETIQQAITNARNNASSSYSGGNIDNAMRQQFKSILKSRALRRGFTPEELDWMQRMVVRGSTVGNMARAVGKTLGGAGGFPTVLASSLGAAELGPAGAFAPVIGYAFKKLSDVMTKTQIDKLDLLVRSRSPLAKKAQTALANYGQAAQQTATDSSLSALMRLVVASHNLSELTRQAGAAVSTNHLVNAGASDSNQHSQ